MITSQELKLAQSHQKSTLMIYPRVQSKSTWSLNDSPNWLNIKEDEYKEASSKQFKESSLKERSAEFLPDPHQCGCSSRTRAPVRPPTTQKLRAMISAGIIQQQYNVSNSIPTFHIHYNSYKNQSNDPQKSQIQNRTKRIFYS